MAPLSANTKKIAVSAASAALASVCIILTNFIPLRVTLLMFAAGCFYIAFDKAGIVYGLLTIAASILISFFTKPFSSAFFLTVIVFAPYSLIAYFMRKLFYTHVKSAAIRLAVAAVFANIAFAAVYFLVKLLTVSIDFAVMDIVGKLGYAVVSLILTVFFMLFDVVFNQVTLRMSKLIK